MYTHRCADAASYMCMPANICIYCVKIGYVYLGRMRFQSTCTAAPLQHSTYVCMYVCVYTRRPTTRFVGACDSKGICTHAPLQHPRYVCVLQRCSILSVERHCSILSVDHLFVSTCVHKYICICIYIDIVCIYTHIYAFMYVHAHMSVSMYICMYVCAVLRCGSNVCGGVRSAAYIQSCTYAHTCVDVCIYMHMYV